MATKASLITEIATNFPDNTIGAITPLLARTAYTDFVNSWQQATSVRTVTTTSDTLVAADYGTLVQYNSASAVAVALAVASSLNPYNVFLQNIGAGAVTVTPTTSTIGGQSNLVLTQGEGAWVISDGTNYQLGPMGAAASATAICPAQGRLTLTANTPVLTSSVSAATSTIYTAYNGNNVPVLISGQGWAMTSFTSDLTQTLADTTKSPAATVASSVYDLFVWWDSTLPGLRCTRGPLWTNTTTRSAGTALTRRNGILVNNAAITNGPAANFGTYVGTIATNAGNTVDFIFGGAASGGTAGVLNVWNMYNRVDVVATVTDSGAGYTYTSGTQRQARASAGNGIIFVSGLAEEALAGTYCAQLTTVAVVNAAGVMQMKLDSAAATDPTNAFYYTNPTAASVNMVQTPAVNYPPQLGQHTLMAVEGGDGTNANTFNGGSSNTLTGRFRM